MGAPMDVMLTPNKNETGLPPGVHLTRPEALRKLAHVLAFWPAFFLPWLTPLQAMLVTAALLCMNLFLLPRFGKILYRSEEPGMGALEIVLYPSALMACVAAFGGQGKPGWYLPVGAAWFGLAVVDACIGLACRLLPQGRSLPWNSRKPILAVFLGTLAACGPAWLLTRWALPSEALPSGALTDWGRAWGTGWGLVGLLGAVAVCALAETTWFGIADNIIIPFALSILLPLVPNPLMTGAALPASSWVWALVPVAFGIATYAARLLTVGGSALGGLLALTLVLAEPWLFAFLAGFFILGNAATRFGIRRKQNLGIAQARNGKRGAAEVFGAMGLAAWMTPLVHIAKSGEAALVSPALLVCIAPLVAKTMDTVSSEIGKALGGRTLSLRTFRAVPPGTKGGVSLWGTLFGLAGAGLLASFILFLGWGGWAEVLILMAIAVAANLFESYWGEWAGPRGMDVGAHTNVLMTLVAAVLAWIWWFGIR